ncbi:hypothetical protein J6590_023971 [Homalodisca vitripennis]|nr:hypothetical protein J6590_023971 [Homalodisca vitripennis]
MFALRKKSIVSHASFVGVHQIEIACQTLFTAKGLTLQALGACYVPETLLVDTALAGIPEMMAVVNPGFASGSCHKT